MTNNKDLLYNNGYSSDELIPYFEKMAFNVEDRKPQ